MTTITDDDLINNPKQGTAGSISGFDSIELSSDPSLSETNQSIVVLIAALQNLVNQYTPEKMRMIERTILSHVRDYNNPHHDTLENVSGGDLSEIFAEFMPGTVPLFPPVVSYVAAMEMGNPYSSLQVSRSTEMNVIDEQGFLSYCGPNEAAIDWSMGYPVIPCYPQVNQYLLSMDISALANSSITLANTSMATNYNSGIIPQMYSTQTTFLATAITTTSPYKGANVFGATLTLDTTSVSPIPTTGSFSIFIYPSVSTGAILISAGTGSNIAQGAFILSLDNKSLIANTGGTGYLNILPNGWYRVTIPWSPTKTSSITLNCQYVNAKLENTTDYISLGSGTATKQVATPNAGDALFTLACPNLTDCPAPAPFNASTTAMGATVLTYPGFDKAQAQSEGMFNLAYTLFADANYGTAQTLLSTDSGVTYKCGAQSELLTLTLPVQTTPITFTVSAVATSSSNTTDANYLTDMAFSISPNKVSFLTTDTVRQDVTSIDSSYSGLPATKSISFGPFIGGIHAFSQFAIADDKKALEFLTSTVIAS